MKENPTQHMSEKERFLGNLPDRSKVVLNFKQLDEDQDYWEVDIPGSECLPFFNEVYPNLTFGDLCRMPSWKMVQVKFAAKGYGYIVQVNGDTRW